MRHEREFGWFRNEIFGCEDDWEVHGKDGLPLSWGNKSDGPQSAMLRRMTVTRLSSPNIECIKGDVQLGKRVHACIIMWMSIYIYKRPVLYLFRPLNIDKEQLTLWKNQIDLCFKEKIKSKL